MDYVKSLGICSSLGHTAECDTHTILILPLLLGCAFAWGMGSNLQLATGDEEDAWSPVQMSGQQLENRTILSVTGGGQHTVLLVKERQS